MKIIEFTFVLGIIFITFNAIWSLFTLVLQVSSRGVGKLETYIHRITQGYFLVALTAIASVDFYESQATNTLFFWYMIGGFFLVVYLTSKMDERRKAIRFMLQINKLQIKPQILKYEWIVVLGIVVLYFISFYYNSVIDLSFNHRFYNFIQGVFNTPVIGWILGLIGCFFFLSMLSKSVYTLRKSWDSILILIGLRKKSTFENQYEDVSNDEDHFIDYEEVFEEGEEEKGDF